MSYSNLDSKASRAVWAYLFTLASGAAGTKDDIFHAYDSRDQEALPRTIVDVGQARPDVDFVGNFEIPILIRIVASASAPIQNAGQAAVNPDAARLAFDARVAATVDALCISDQGGVDLAATARLLNTAGRALATAADGSADAIAFAANHADMADFTCTMWKGNQGFQKINADPETATWAKVILFTGVFCSANVD